MKKTFTEKEKQQFIEICESSITMSEACSKLNMHFNTFKRYALEFNCYKPNQGLKGGKRGYTKTRINTLDILNGKYPNYQTYKLKKRLIDEGYFKDECMICGWNIKAKGAKYTSCELHHIDGNKTNHNLDNLQLICPNCHSLTANYRSRNK